MFPIADKSASPTNTPPPCISQQILLHKHAECHNLPACNLVSCVSLLQKGVSLLLKQVSRRERAERDQEAVGSHWRSADAPMRSEDPLT